MLLDQKYECLLEVTVGIMQDFVVHIEPIHSLLHEVVAVSLERAKLSDLHFGISLSLTTDLVSIEAPGLAVLVVSLDIGWFPGRANEFLRIHLLQLLVGDLNSSLFATGKQWLLLLLHSLDR